MKALFFSFYLLMLATVIACGDDANAQRNIVPQDTIQPPNFNYVLDVPEGWGTYDTMFQDLRTRLILAPESLDADKPRGNLIIASMTSKSIDTFTIRNITTLKENDPTVVVQETGSMEINKLDARWFTYTRAQNGIERDMINYIIPLRGFAYMITCGSNKGTMHKYRKTFDGIAHSFRE